MNSVFRSSLSAAAAFALAGCAFMPSRPIDITLVALNDLHGTLEAHEKLLRENGEERKVTMGGIVNIAGQVAQWRREDPELVVVAAGDMIGASPTQSGMFADEPTIEALDTIGLRVSSVGNHEFDNGGTELLRQQNGGCDSVLPTKACKWRGGFGGAKYGYLAANVVVRKTGQTLLPAYRILEVKGLRIGFIGAVVRDTRDMIKPSYIADIEFTDEVEAINLAAADLRRQGVTTQVLLIHEGARVQELKRLSCDEVNGPIRAFLPKLDRAISVVVSGHSHNAYECQLDGRILTQAEAYGHVLTRIRITVDPRTGAMLSGSSEGVDIMPGKVAPDAQQEKLMAELRARSADLLNRPIARLGAARLIRDPNKHAESVMGNLIADAQFAALQVFGVDVAMTNHGSFRGNLEGGPDGLTYGQASFSHPYGNTLMVATLTGAQLYTMLEQQNLIRTDAGGLRTLQSSAGFTYTWDGSKPRGARIVAGSVKLRGVAVRPEQKIRLGVNNYLALGADGFAILKEATEVIDTHILDLDAFIDYITAADKAGKPAGSDQYQGRAVRIN